MKNVLIVTITLFMALVANAQDLPYAKYLYFNKSEFKENHFKYDDDTNTWALRKTNGWHTAFNVLPSLLMRWKRYVRAVMTTALSFNWEKRISLLL